MRIFVLHKSRLGQAGDTIIEVLIAVSILALVMTVAYESTSRSLANGIDSSNRQQALALAAQQVEIIKDAAANSTTALANYQLTGNYCIDPTALGNAESGRSTTACTLINGLYNLADTYNSSSGLFTINASWPSRVSGNGTSQLTLYYR